MDNSIIARLHRLVNNHDCTISQAVEQVIPGADVGFWTTQLADYDPNAKPVKPKSKSKTRRPSRSKRKLHCIVPTISALQQEAKRGKAMAELVSRTNDEDDA